MPLAAVLRVRRIFGRRIRERRPGDGGHRHGRPQKPTQAASQR